MNIITGPNMSGKSTYLQQVALIVILAQAGCYVPAEYASVPIFAHFFSRVGTFDSIETNSSTFTVEMTEMAHILSHATPKSLVIIDELGRGTSTDDGTGIAWAMAEELMSIGAFTLLATHFSGLKELATIYPTCKVWQLEVGVTGNSLDFRWKVKAASQHQDNVHYGLLLAAAAGIPESIIQHATAIAQDLDEQEKAQACTASRQGSHSLSEVYSLAHKLSCLAMHCKNEDDITPELLEHLAGLQDDARIICAALDAEESQRV
jgi:DNA mismatch repair protein MSH4